MNKVLSFLLLVASFAPLFSQPVYFNHLIRTQGNEQARGIIQRDSLYYVYGTKFDTISVRNKGFLYKLNQNGALLEEKNWGNDQFEYFSPPSGGILSLDPSRIALCGGIRDTTQIGGQPIDCGFLMLTNSNGDSIVQKRYYDTISPYPFSYMFFEDIARTPDKGYILAGGIGWSLANEIKEILLKTDSLGNQEWMKTYGTNGIQFRGYTLDVTPDNGYVVTGWKDDGYQYDGWILKTDQYGTMQWQKVLGGQYDDFINAACITPDGNIVVVLNEQFQDAGSLLMKTKVIKYSLAGNVIWIKSYYYNRSINCRSILALNDNSLVLTGYNFVIDTILQKYAEPSYIFKLNSQGDSVWFRHFIYHSSNPNVLDYMNRCTAIDMIKTPDGGFLVCGDYMQTPPNVVPQSSWLVKLDSLGCDTPGCQFIGLPKGYVPDISMLAYPNPTTGITAIWSESFAQGGTVVYTLYDAAGKLVKSGEERLNGYSFELNLRHLPPGMYHLSVQQNGKAAVKSRIVKKH